LQKVELRILRSANLFLQRAAGLAQPVGRNEIQKLADFGPAGMEKVIREGCQS